MNNDKEDKDKKTEKESLNRFAKYSTMGIEMAVIIGFGTWAGVALDDYCGNTTPGFTIGFSLFSVFGSLYLFIKRVMNDN